MRKRTKFLLLRISVILAFTILAGRIWYIQVVMGSYYRTQADTSKIRLVSVEAHRGVIYDSHGRQLVYNAPSWRIEIVPHGIPHLRAHAIYRQLSTLLNGNPSPAGIRQIVQQNLWHPYDPALIKTRVDPARAMVIMQLHHQLPGVRAEPTSIRQYVQSNNDPYWPLAHILGYTSKIDPATYTAYRQAYPSMHVQATDQLGREGVEASMDPYLHGVNGTDQVEVDAGERPVRVLQHGQTVSGDSVYLTIDWKLQQQVAADLAAALHKLNVPQGIVVLEDVHTGRILSMVSLPTYNANWFSGGINTKRYDTLLNAPGQPLNDLATAGQFPPGSTYKVVTAAAALGTGVADAGRYIDDTGAIKLGGGQTFAGWKASGLGSVNIVGALAMSSDIYFYTVAGGNPNDGPMPYIGGTRLAQYARLFGLGSKTGIEIPGEQPGLVPDPQWYRNLPPTPNLKNPGDSWHIGDNYNMAIGQGFNLATPLQMADIASTIANGGILYRPRIVDHVYGRIVPHRGILSRPRIIQPFVPTIVRRDFLNPDYLALIQEGMHASVTNSFNTGTSYYVYDPRIDAAGKTGTAEAKTSAGVSSPDAWWIGYAPYNNPQVAIAVLVPNANSEGAYAAAPIAHKVLEDYFHLPPLKPNWLADEQQILVGAGAQ